MSTPFIVTREKQQMPFERLMVLSVFSALVLGPFYYFGKPFMTGNHVLPPPPTVQQETHFIWAVLYTLLAACVLGAVAVVREQIVKRAVDVSPRVVAGLQIFALRSPGDEASLVLGWGDWFERLNALLRRILNALTIRLAGRIREYGKRAEPYFAPALMILSVGVSASGMAMIWMEETGRKDIGEVYLALTPVLLVLLPLCALLAVLIVIAILGGCSMVVTAIASLGYGIEYCLIGWAASTTCETTPLDTRGSAGIHAKCSQLAGKPLILPLLLIELSLLRARSALLAQKSPRPRVEQSATRAKCAAAIRNPVEHWLDCRLGSAADTHPAASARVAAAKVAPWVDNP